MSPNKPIHPIRIPLIITPSSFLKIYFSYELYFSQYSNDIKFKSILKKLAPFSNVS